MILVYALFLLLLSKNQNNELECYSKKPCFCCVSLLKLIIIIINKMGWVCSWLIDLQFVKAFCYNTISMYHYTIIKFYIRFFKHLWNKQQVHLAFFHRHINCIFFSFELLFNFRIFKKNSDENCASLTNEKKFST